MEKDRNIAPKLNSQFFENFHLNDSIDRLEEIMNTNLKEYYLSNDVKEFIIYCLNQLKKIKWFVKNEIRFDYISIQNEMDRLYKEDSSITGYNIVFDFEITKNPNRAKFKVQKLKTN
ncbi:hypothetical protein CLV86_2834 [Lacinutrix venerupis]|uniref:hypothetical protein n=1 Tax=Lacinutrix venerupis TaxID=1486034 RepID=UPI000EAC6C6A|nr:hypothetical protein [Lacinutrix venerupis]RLJ60773.1 hypothetical protein CLV86_2834 [Lacinutrix venerupis]